MSKLDEITNQFITLNNLEKELEILEEIFPWKLETPSQHHCNVCNCDHAFLTLYSSYLFVRRKQKERIVKNKNVLHNVFSAILECLQSAQEHANEKDE